jgi:hypothetical protein
MDKAKSNPADAFASLEDIRHPVFFLPRGNSMREYQQYSNPVKQNILEIIKLAKSPFTLDSLLVSVIVGAGIVCLKLEEYLLNDPDISSICTYDKESRIITPL